MLKTLDDTNIGATTMTITTLSIMTPSIKSFYGTQHDNTVSSTVMLSIIMFSAALLFNVMLNVSLVLL
jgi:hypothetical protein